MATNGRQCSKRDQSHARMPIDEEPVKIDMPFAESIRFSAIAPDIRPRDSEAVEGASDQEAH